jgi:calcineurin-like phosphoesterase family protein
MDRVLIDNWNTKVSPEDTIYHLGDFTLKPVKEFYEYTNQLTGFIKIVPGGHDYLWQPDFKMTRSINPRIQLLPPLYSLEIPTDDRYPLVVVLCHYAMRVWDRSHYNSYHLYGHSHGNLEGVGKSMDVGVDCNNFYPYSLDEIMEILE